jgi:protein-S-isoprenylcysteine O-methyltransferase Ste14
LISWVLLFASIPILVLGMREMRKLGGSSQARQGENLYEFERTTQLVTSGIFRYIRHPMYSSLLFLAWGVFFKLPSWLGAGLALVTTGFLLLTAKRDETADLEYFGDSYREYMQHTKRFVPWVF